MSGKPVRAIAAIVASFGLVSALACASGSSAAPPPTAVPAVPYACCTGQNSNLAYLSPAPANAQPVIFDFATLLAPSFPTTYEAKWKTPSGILRTEIKGNPNRTTFACKKVVTVDEYGLVFGEDNYPGFDEDHVLGRVSRNILYVFKKLPSSQSGLGFVGAAPEFGEQKQFGIVKGYGTFGDLLVVGSDVRHT